MKKCTHFLALLFSVSLTFSFANHTHAGPYDRPNMYYVKVGAWPKPYAQTVNRIVSELLTGQECYVVVPGTNNEIATTDKSDVRCSRFLKYTSDKSLKPWKRNQTNKEYRIEFIQEPNMKPRIALNFYEWDGKKVRRVSGSSWEFEGESEEWIRRLIVSYTLK